MNKVENPPHANEEQREFLIQSMYIKDLSFESPNAPNIFKEPWQPDLNLQIQTSTSMLEEHMYEVVLKLTVTVKSTHDKVAFLVEVKQAGVFTLKNFPTDQLNFALGSVCPSMLFPYAREAVSNMVMRGGFPQLLLAPVDFEALYFNHTQKADSSGEKALTGETQH